MLKLLLKVRLKGLLDSIFNRRRGKKTAGIGMKILFGFLTVYLIAAFGFIFGMMFLQMYDPFTQMGMGWLYYSMAGLMAAMLCFVGSVFFTQSVIFEAKDNELLLALPIRTSAIIGSRMLLLLLVNYGFSLVIMGTCGVVRCFQGAVTALGVVRFLLCYLLLPLLPTTLSCIVGWLIALIIRRLNHKNIFTMVLSLAFMGAYFYFCFNMQSAVERLVANGAAIGDAIRQVIPPIYALGLALFDGNWLQLLDFALWCILPFLAVYALLSLSFVRIATAKHGGKKVKYQAKTMHAASIRWAMTVKELRRLGNSSAYMLNGCIGAILCVAISVLTLIKGQGILQALTNIYAGGADVSQYTMAFACVIECLTLSMTIISAPSISLEGKNLWLLQSAPVRAADVLLPKVFMHLIVVGPASLISSLLFALALPMTETETVLLFIVPLLLTICMALLGVVFNLRWPRFDYTNESAVIKQSASSTITMFSGMGIVLLPTLLYVFLLRKYLSLQLTMILFAGLLAVADLVMYDYLAHRSEKAFARLTQK